MMQTDLKPDVAVPRLQPNGWRQAATMAICEAAQWYAANRGACERPIIPTLRQRFGLTAHEAVCAIRASSGTKDLNTAPAVT
ncbi:hypothetical protein [Mesorhizobium sp.]|uniref:hypothetical protein n=1 Tax=Mesorhizobium sp. TaxID=1871066 RepID=UPI000FE9EFAA|nr:hypothetical protein [Mesorhizobium sp.]RWO61333.1 MAG: hypothetical protein EOS14_08620 [Mesorhizobium sp.]